MGILEWVITAFGTLLFIIVFFAVLFALKARGEKKLKDEGAIRTRNPKMLQGFFLGFAILVFFGGAAGLIYCAITDAEHTTATVVAVLALCVVVFSAIGLFGFLLVHCNYVISTDEGIEAHRLFQKTKFYRYEEILYFQDSTSLGMMGGLIGYGANGKKIFAVEAAAIGVNRVADRLREHNVHEKNNSPRRFL